MTNFDDYLDYMKDMWRWMFAPPWHKTGIKGPSGEEWEDEHFQFSHWVPWLFGWGCTIAGSLLGALLATSLVQTMGITNTTFQDAVVIALAVLFGFVLQALGWGLMALDMALWIKWIALLLRPKFVSLRLAGRIDNYSTYVLALIPVALGGYGVYRYLVWVGPGQSTVNIALVGILLAKMLFLIIKGIMTGALFKRFMRWLHGKAAAAG